MEENKIGKNKFYLQRFEKHKNYLCEDRLGKITIGWKKAQIVDITDRYIIAMIYERNFPRFKKFSRRTGKEFRPYYRNYKLLEISIESEEI